MFTRTDKTEYEANLFAADLLIKDEAVLALAKDDGADCFSMAKRLRVMPELLAFKFHSMRKWGFDFPLPLALQSGFLA